MVPQKLHESSGAIWGSFVPANRLAEKLRGVRNQIFLTVVHVCFPHLLFFFFSNSFLSPPPHPFFYLSPPLQIPSAGQLMEAVRVKMKERKVLTEELAMLTTPVSEKAWLPGLRLGKLSSHPPTPPVPAWWEPGWAKLSRGSRTNICEKSTVDSLWATGSTQQPYFCKWALDICVSAQCTLSIRQGPLEPS